MRGHVCARVHMRESSMRKFCVLLLLGRDRADDVVEAVLFGRQLVVIDVLCLPLCRYRIRGCMYVCMYEILVFIGTSLVTTYHCLWCVFSVCATTAAGYCCVRACAHVRVFVRVCIACIPACMMSVPRIFPA